MCKCRVPCYCRPGLAQLCTPLWPLQSRYLELITFTSDLYNPGSSHLSYNVSLPMWETEVGLKCKRCRQLPGAALPQAAHLSCSAQHQRVGIATPQLAEQACSIQCCCRLKPQRVERFSHTLCTCQLSLRLNKAAALTALGRGHDAVETLREVKIKVPGNAKVRPRLLHSPPCLAVVLIQQLSALAARVPHASIRLRQQHLGCSSSAGHISSQHLNASQSRRCGTGSDRHWLRKAQLSCGRQCRRWQKLMRWNRVTQVRPPTGASSAPNSSNQPGPRGAFGCKASHQQG